MKFAKDLHEMSNLFFFLSLYRLLNLPRQFVMLRTQNVNENVMVGLISDSHQ